MAINGNLIQRPSDRSLFLAAAIGFPLLVFIGYFKTYYFSALFDVRPVANSLVHIHGIVMSVWVLFFVAQTYLIRSKNIRLHITLGMAGIALAAIVVITGLMTAYDAQIVREAAPPGINPHSFLIYPVADMVLFVILFTGAIYFRKRPAEHKSLMLLTAINFLPAALFRFPIFPEESVIHFAFGIPNLMAIICLIWFTAKHGKLNKIFAAGVLLLLIAQPMRNIIGDSAIWLNFVKWIAS